MILHIGNILDMLELGFLVRKVRHVGVLSNMEIHPYVKLKMPALFLDLGSVSGVRKGGTFLVEPLQEWV